MKVVVQKNNSEHKYLLSFNNLSLDFGSKNIFSNFTIDIAYSNIVLLKGKIGSGKSSLLKIIGGIIDLYDGSFTHVNQIDNINVSSIYLNSDPACNFITGYIDDELTFADIKDKSIFHDYIGKSIYELSGGQLKKISLLMALHFAKGRVILADEPLEMLDDLEVENLCKAIIEYSYISPFIISTHDDYLDKYADVIIYID